MSAGGARLSGAERCGARAGRLVVCEGSGGHALRGDGWLLIPACAVAFPSCLGPAKGDAGAIGGSVADIAGRLRGMIGRVGALGGATLRSGGGGGGGGGGGPTRGRPWAPRARAPCGPPHPLA